MRLLEVIEAKGELSDYHLLPVARADFLRSLQRWPEAASSYRRALALTTNEAERRLQAVEAAQIGG
jgi:RNA polymerase sigma-70 factor (ECF subfamily)